MHASRVSVAVVVRRDGRLSGRATLCNIEADDTAETICQRRTKYKMNKNYSAKNFCLLGQTQSGI